MDSVYQRVLTEVLERKTDETTFGRLRDAYAQSIYYSPGNSGNLLDRLKTLSDRGDYQKVIDLGSKHAEKLMPLGRYHFHMKTAYRALGDDGLSKWHDFVQFQLLSAILRIGDGKGTKSALRVISV